MARFFRANLYIVLYKEISIPLWSLPPPTEFFFVFWHLYWSIIALQWCVSCCCTTKWISYTYTYIPISPPSWASLTPSLSHPSRSSQSIELISLCYAAASHYLSILHLAVYICQCYSLTSSQLPLPHCVLKSIRYICVFIPALPLGSSILLFRFHIYALAYSICFPLSDLLHSVWQTLGPSTSLQITQFRSFLWLSNIPLYICATSSLSIHLSMDT